MYTGLQHTHSYLAYLALTLLAIAVINALMGYFAKRTFSDTDRKIGLFALIGAHLQLLLGLILYFVSPKGIANFSGEHMKDALARLYMLEHPLINIIAIALITYGYTRMKKGADAPGKFRSVYVYYGIGLILILSRIPWTQWLG